MAARRRFNPRWIAAVVVLIAGTTVWVIALATGARWAEWVVLPTVLVTLGLNIRSIRLDHVGRTRTERGQGPR